MCETINDRIEQLVKTKFRGNRAAFARALGMTDSALGGYLGQRRSKPSVEIVSKIIRIFNVDARWLLLGENETSHSVQITQTGEQLSATGHGNISNNYCDEKLYESRIELLQALIDEKDKRIAELKEYIEILRKK